MLSWVPSACSSMTLSCCHGPPRPAGQASPEPVPNLVGVSALLLRYGIGAPSWGPRRAHHILATNPTPAASPCGAPAARYRIARTRSVFGGVSALVLCHGTGAPLWGPKSARHILATAPTRTVSPFGALRLAIAWDTEPAPYLVEVCALQPRYGTGAPSWGPRRAHHILAAGRTHAARQ